MNGKRGEGIHAAFMRPQHFRRSNGVDEEGPPTNVLWIGYPPSVRIDEQMLHNAMILFGEIEGIKCFPSMNCAFVEFRSIKEARCVKERLQGRLFNDPRIHILFSRNNLPPSPRLGGPRPDMFFNEPQIRPVVPFGSSSPVSQNDFHVPIPIPRSNVPSPRPFVQGVDPYCGGSEYLDFPNGGRDHMPPNWRYHSPSLPAGIQPPFRPVLSEWDRNGTEMRDPKMSSFDGSPSNDALCRARWMNDGSIIEPSGFPHFGTSNPGPSQYNDVVRDHGHMHDFDIDYQWRGALEKGGAHVCHVRSMPLGIGIRAPFPSVLNFFAKTGLEKLAKHYEASIGTDMAFFLPDSEEDFDDYTDFLQFLSQRNQSMVAKLEDGTTLFLVPPSDFLATVSNVSHPKYLHGIVLHLPERSRSSEARQSVPEAHRGFSVFPQNVDQRGSSSASMIQDNQAADPSFFLENKMHLQKIGSQYNNQASLSYSNRDSSLHSMQDEDSSRTQDSSLHIMQAQAKNLSQPPQDSMTLPSDQSQSLGQITTESDAEKKKKYLDTLALARFILEYQPENLANEQANRGSSNDN